jgi:hypothetical protein
MLAAGLNTVANFGPYQQGNKAHLRNVGEAGVSAHRMGASALLGVCEGIKQLVSEDTVVILDTEGVGDVVCDSAHPCDIESTGHIVCIRRNHTEMCSGRKAASA